MKRLALGVVTVLVFGSLFSAATTFAAWQVWQLNTLLQQAAIPGALGPFVAAPPSASLAEYEDDCGPLDAADEPNPALAALPYTPALAAPPAETRSGDHKQVVFIDVEANGAPIEVGVDDRE